MAKRAATEPVGPLQALGPPSILTFLPEPDLLEHPTFMGEEEIGRQQDTKTGV